MAKTLIQARAVLTMDSELGDVAPCGILIEDGMISAVGKDIEAPPDAEVIDAAQCIALPGFVNAHQHTWQTAIRGIAGDWSLVEYFRHMHQTIGPRFEPKDTYIANLMGALNQLNGGATTLFDWCHNNPTPEHTDAGVEGLRESGIRAVFGHGTPKPKIAPGETPLSHRPHPSEEIKRLRTGSLSSNDGLITLAMATRGPDLSTYEMCAHDIRLAREYDLLWSAHIGGRFEREAPEGIKRLAAEGLLGPDFNAVHANQLADDEIKLLVDNGCSVTSCPEVEMQMGHGLPVIGRLLMFGAAPTLGIDVESNVSGDMFTMMRMALQFTRAQDNQKILDAEISPKKVSIIARRALEWATIEGARALRLSDKTGSLTPGKQADVILIRMNDLNIFPVNNPLEAVVFQAAAVNVDSVFVAGQAVKKGGELLYPRLKEKMEELAESGKALLEPR